MATPLAAVIQPSELMPSGITRRATEISAWETKQALLTTGSYNIAIGNRGVADEANTIRIGSFHHTNTYIAGISGVTIASGAPVVIDANGHLGTADISTLARPTG